MYISAQDWKKFIKSLSEINKASAEAIVKYVQKYGFDNVDDLVGFAYSVVDTFGDASASLAADMYDEIADLEGKFYPPAELADTPDFGEVAKTVYGVLKTSDNPNELGGAVSRLVKRTGQDTLLKNGIRDGAEFAWIPSGDTCPFCIALASRGWQRISKKSLKNGHAEHIHSNCDCSYMIRHSDDIDVAGYDPDRYLQVYNSAEGKTPNDKINSMRRMQYAERKEVINAQKKEAEALRNLRYKLSDNEGAFRTVDERRNEDRKSIIKPHNIIENLNKTEVGREALSLIEKNKTAVKLCYGVDNKDSSGNRIMGSYNPFDNTITIYADETKTIMETAKTAVHEAFHMSDYGFCQKSEVYCMMKEKQHEKNGEPLTREEMKGIIQTVRKLYSFMPWET